MRVIQRVSHQLNGEQRRANFHDEHHWVFHERARIQLYKGIPYRAARDFSVPDRLAFLCLGCHIFNFPQKVLPAFISRCSRIGPRLRAGKKVRAPTIKMVETSKPAKSPPVTGKVPADSGTVFFFARLPAMASTGMIMKKRPSSWATAVVVLYHMVFALIPPNAEPLFPVDDTYAYNTCDRPCGPGLVMPAVP